MTNPGDLEPSDDWLAAEIGAEGSVPVIPVIRETEKYRSGLPYPLLDGIPRTIGWQWRPDARGGLAFVIISRGAMGGLKVQETFPLTADGWRNAWHSLAQADPAAARRVAVRLAARAAEDAAARDGSAVLAPPPPPRFRPRRVPAGRF